MYTDAKDKLINSLWAKKEEQNGVFYWLPLIVHLADTMNVSRWLWNNWISDSQRAFCIRSISRKDEQTASDLAAFFGAVHDIGKATPAFQTQRGFNNSADLDAALLEKLERAGFSGISELYLADPGQSPHSVAGQYILKKYGIKDDIGSVIGGHHGKPLDGVGIILDQAAYRANYLQCEKLSEVSERWEYVQSSILYMALNACGFESIDNLPEMSLTAQMIYSGILIMADWIASNSNYFPLIDIDDESIPDHAVRYKNGITSWQKNLPLQIQSFPSMDELFTRRFGYKPRDFQKAVYQTVSETDKPGIIILEAPMGLGKTEAALASAEEIMAKTGSSGLFFGLPTQATSNGMFGRVYDWLKSLTAEYDTVQSLRLCHGKAALNEDMNRLKEECPMDIDIDEGRSSSVFVNEWFSGRKKTSLDDYVVGTVDGFLLTALKQKHLSLRHLGFSKKVVIIDEVHAYDAYMQVYLEEAVQWMGSYGTPVILVSATLPKDKRRDLITAYLNGKGMKKREMVFPEEMSGNSYPLVSYTDGTEIKVNTDFLPITDKAVSVKRLDEEVLLEKVAWLMEGGGNIGVIVNTVRKAQRLGKECRERFGKDKVDILHSAFIATDRVRKESDLIEKIGKNGKRPYSRIIIGTQVIEQSLDIDFDVLITDLCPMDLLLQRIGRLHRHDIPRPEKHQKPVVYVMGMSDDLEFESGSEMIYGSYYLIRTQYYLPETISIPSDIPVLVNKVYGHVEPELSEEKNRLYQKSKSDMKNLKDNKKWEAMKYRLGNPESRIKPEKYNMLEMLKNPDNSETEEMAAAQVRDIRETIEIIAVRKLGEGYGLFDNDEDISDRICESAVAMDLAKQTIRLPDSVVSKRGGAGNMITILENYNKCFLREWQDQPWLKGCLGIIFDETGRFDLDGIMLEYDNEFGLREVKDYGKV